MFFNLTSPTNKPSGTGGADAEPILTIMVIILFIIVILEGIYIIVLKVKESKKNEEIDKLNYELNKKNKLDL